MKNKTAALAITATAPQGTLLFSALLLQCIVYCLSR
jgi:hypothetical protein